MVIYFWKNSDKIQDEIHKNSAAATGHRSQPKIQMLCRKKKSNVVEHLKFLISSKIKKSNVLKHLKKNTKCFKTFEKITKCYTTFDFFSTQHLNF